MEVLCLDFENEKFQNSEIITVKFRRQNTRFVKVSCSNHFRSIRSLCKNTISKASSKRKEKRNRRGEEEPATNPFPPYRPNSF